jgi:MFS family permease
MPEPETGKRSWRNVVPALLRERAEFRSFWAAQLISLVGDQITLIALPLVAVLNLGADARQMGFLLASGLLPNLLFALPAGAWVDRHGHRRRVMVAADLGRAAVLTTIPVAHALGVLTLTQLYVAAFLSGTLSVFFSVSYSTLFVSIVPRDRYLEGSSILNGTRAMANMGGPSLGGLLVEVLSGPLALVVDVLSFLGSAFFMARIAPREPPTEQTTAGQRIGGVGFILHSPIIRAALAATATINFFNFVFQALFVLYATRSLGIGPALLGAVLGAGALGALVGSMLTTPLSKRIGVGPAFILGCVLFPLPLVLVPLAAGPRLLVLGFLFAAEFGSGLGVMILDISFGSILATLVPDRLRARVSGAYMVVNYGVRPIGSILGGVLGGSIGLRPTLWIAAVGALAGFLWLLRSPTPRLRTLDQAAEIARREETDALIRSIGV